jgi:acyl-CoA synthetase (NDP forming)
VRAHSSALAGEDAAFDALFDAYGVARVRTLDELMDTLVLFSAGPIPATYARFLENSLREALGLSGVPIRLTFRRRR